MGTGEQLPSIRTDSLVWQERFVDSGVLFHSVVVALVKERLWWRICASKAVQTQCFFRGAAHAVMGCRAEDGQMGIRVPMNAAGVRH